MKNCEFAVEVQDFDKDAFKRLKEARELVSKTEAEIVKAYVASDRYRAVRDLAGIGDMGTKHMPITRIEGFKITCRVNVDIDDGKAAPSVRPTLYLGEKTVNMLLNGKLLDDGQKRALLKQIGLDVDALSA